MGGNSKETLGRYLKRERESRKVSLEELSRGTRISRPFLEALERDDFPFFSQREFIPGFLKGYTRHLGLDPDEVLRRYKIQSELERHKGSFRQLSLFPNSFPSPEEIPEPEKAPQRVLPPHEKRHSHRWILMQVAIIIVAISLSFYLHSLLNHSRNSKQPSEAGDALPAGVEKNGFSQEEKGIKSGSSEKSGSLPREAHVLPEKKSAKTTPAKNGPPEVGTTVGQIEKKHPQSTFLPNSPKVRPAIGNRENKTYYLPGMVDYGKVEPINRVEFGSEEEAVKAGYRKAPPGSGKN